MDEKKKSISGEIEIIKNEVDLLLGKLHISSETEVSHNGEFFQINISAEEEDSGILIGYHGETLQALQLILSLLVSKKLGDFVRIIVNVGDYREKREEKLRELAFDAARRAKETRQDVVLENLSSWQRRVVHIALAEDEEVQTESQGEEPDRQLVIKPK